MIRPMTLQEFIKEQLHEFGYGNDSVISEMVLSDLILLIERWGDYRSGHATSTSIESEFLTSQQQVKKIALNLAVDLMRENATLSFPWNKRDDKTGKWEDNLLLQLTAEIEAYLIK